MKALVTTSRVAPGLLTLEAWEVLRAAPAVCASDLDDPQVRAIVAAGIDVVLRSPESGLDDVWIVSPADTIGAHTEVVHGSYDLPGASLIDMVDVMDRLRLGCPWTKLQTHQSLSHYLLEEAHEALEALDAGDSEHLREELGDLLMQVVFHARIAAEDEDWAIDDVIEGITAKLIYRNPHVFAGQTVAGAEEVDANWQALKATEKQRDCVMDGISPTLPALALADKVLGRLDTVPSPGADIGGRLIALVLEARAAGIDAETALRQAVRALVVG